MKKIEEKIDKYLDVNVSIVDLNRGPNEFTEIWTNELGKTKEFSKYKTPSLSGGVLGFYNRKTREYAL